MNKVTVDKDRFDRAAREAVRQFEDEIDLRADGGNTIPAEEAFAQAIADLRSLLFDYC